MRYILAWFCPWLGFLTIGKPGKAFFAFILQCTLIGWPIAFWWSIISTAHYYADKRTDRIVNAIKETRPPQPNFGYPGYQPPPGIPPQYPQQIPRPSAPAIMARYEHRSTPQPPQNDGYESIMQHDNAARPEPEWQSAPEPMPRPEPQRRARPEPTPARNIGDMLGSFSFPRTAQGPAEPINRPRADEPWKLTDPAEPLPLPRPRESLVEPGFLLAMVFIVLIVAAIPAYKFLAPLVGSIKFPHIFAESPPQPAQPTQAELVFWQSVMNSKDVNDYQNYLLKYPQGQFVELARNRIKRIIEETTASQSNSQAITAQAASPSARDSMSCEDFRDRLVQANSTPFEQFAGVYNDLVDRRGSMPDTCKIAKNFLGGILINTNKTCVDGWYLFRLSGTDVFFVIDPRPPVVGQGWYSGRWIMGSYDTKALCILSTAPLNFMAVYHLTMISQVRVSYQCLSPDDT